MIELKIPFPRFNKCRKMSIITIGLTRCALNRKVHVLSWRFEAQLSSDFWRSCLCLWCAMRFRKYKQVDQKVNLSNAKRSLALHVATNFIKYSLMNLRETRHDRSGEHGFAVRTNERSEVESKATLCERTMMKVKQGFADDVCFPIFMY